MVNGLEDVHEQIGAFFSTALKDGKHEYVSVSGNFPTIPQALFSSPSMLSCLDCSSYSSACSYLPKGPGIVLFCSRQVPPHAHQTRCPNRPLEFYVY